MSEQPGQFDQDKPPSTSAHVVPTYAEEDEMAQQKNQPQGQQQEEKGSMTVEEAGRMGGQRVRELVEEGKQREVEEGGSGFNQTQQGGKNKG